jgi:hypothetical protein
MTINVAVRYVEGASKVKGRGACISNIYETCICTLLIVGEKVVIAGMDASSPAYGHGCPFAGVDLLFHYEQLSTKHVECMLHIQHSFPLLYFERKRKRSDLILRMTSECISLYRIFLQLCNIIVPQTWIIQEISTKFFIRAKF